MASLSLQAIGLFSNSSSVSPQMNAWDFSRHSSSVFPRHPQERVAHRVVQAVAALDPGAVGNRLQERAEIQAVPLQIDQAGEADDKGIEPAGELARTGIDPDVHERLRAALGKAALRDEDQFGAGQGAKSIGIHPPGNHDIPPSVRLGRESVKGLNDFKRNTVLRLYSFGNPNIFGIQPDQPQANRRHAHKRPSLLGNGMMAAL
jgi:hypothetical protein